MKTKIMLLLATVLMSLQAVAQNGKIAGKVVDENNEDLMGAIIEIYSEGKKIAGTASDIDGIYEASVIPGTHELIAKYGSYNRVRIQKIKVEANKTTTININFKPNTIQEVVVLYSQPLIPPDGKVVSGYSSRDIKHAPTRDMSKLVKTQGGISTNGQSGQLYSAGSRSGNTITYLDGIMIRGSVPNISQSTISEPEEVSNEQYKKVAENDFMNVKSSPLSTMSIDVDRAAYANVRRFINDGQRPPVDAVRVEEMINYFSYNYPAPVNDDPIAISTEFTECPWNKDHKLLRIGMQAKTIKQDKLPPSNLVFLIDVSGSMSSFDKLPLLISSMKLLVDNLRDEDKVSIVTYAGSAGLVLPSTPGSQKQTIHNALDRLTSGGSTAGAEGILTAYRVAQENFIKGGNNRIILATDGDFNVGISSDNQLETLITKEREKGIFLSCLGFGTGNYMDAKMEMLADKGNGNYSYIDNIDEGRKTLVSEFGGTLFTVAKDVKAQIEFNPGKVASYRLIGYENRMLNAEDFKDDKKDAGELGAGHTVTFIYEIVPTGIKDDDNRKVANLKYQERKRVKESFNNELATIKFRYKKPDGSKSIEIAHVITDQALPIEHASEDTRFAYSVALFGMILKLSPHKGNGTIDDVIKLAERNKGKDTEGYREEFVELAEEVRDNISVSLK